MINNKFDLSLSYRWTHFVIYRYVTEKLRTIYICSWYTSVTIRLQLCHVSLQSVVEIRDMLSRQADTCFISFCETGEDQFVLCCAAVKDVKE